MLHVKRLGEIFLNYNYDFFGFIIYDSILSDTHLNTLISGNKGVVFPSKRGDEIWKVGLHLMCFNREILKKVIDKIKIENYLQNGSFDAFMTLHKQIVEPLQIRIADEPVEDKIFFYQNYDQFNYSESPRIGFFISSPDEYLENLKFYSSRNAISCRFCKLPNCRIYKI